MISYVGPAFIFLKMLSSIHYSKNIVVLLNDEHPLNIIDNVVATVKTISIDELNDVQFSNIFAAVSTLFPYHVLLPVTGVIGLLKFVHPLNILDIFVTVVVLNPLLVFAVNN